MHAFAVFLLCLVTYLVTLPRAITLEDAGLFQMVCHLGGISHPPGYPLFKILCQQFVNLPFFSGGVFVGNMLSALFAALSAGLFHHICFCYRGRPFAWVASMAYGLSATFWSQALIIEVYSLAVLMFLACWWSVQAFVKIGRITYFYLLGLLYGLALCNHWPLMILSTPALLVLMWPRIDVLLAAARMPTFWLLSTVFILLGLTPYLTLVLAGTPVIGVYGGIESVSDFVRYVTRSMYEDSHAVAGVADKISFAGWLGKETLLQSGYWSAPVLIVGLWTIIRSFPMVVTLALAFMYLGTTYLLVVLLNFDFEFFYTAIFKPYPVIAYLAVAFCFAAGIERIIEAVNTLSSQEILKRTVFVISIGLVFVSNFSINNRRGDTFVEHYGKQVLESLPQNSVLFVYGDFEAALFGYLQLVEGLRPDVELREWESLVFSNRLTSPFASDAEKNEAQTVFIESSSREDYSIQDRLESATDLGLYFRFSRNGWRGYEVSEKTNQFLVYLLELYENELITDPHERYHAYHLLIRLSRTYFNYALQSEANKQEVTSQVVALQATFPGRLVTLETMLQQSLVTPENRNALLKIARQAKSDIPEMVTNKSLAVFYE